MKNAKSTLYYCSGCGYESMKWMGQCPGCGEWNTFNEAPAQTLGSKGSGRRSSGKLRVRSLSSIDMSSDERMDTGFMELSRVLGGGLVRGSLTLVGGDPGIGKSTLLLQAASRMAAAGRKVIYITGEESLRQLRLRADRIGGVSEGLGFLAETDIDSICELLGESLPEVAVIDSIQTMFTGEVQSVPGSVTQVRECAQRLTVTAKSSDIACILVGHVTKEGTVAGPRVLEHMVDTVLYFESGGQFGYRILRSAKNRFGSTNEIGVFEMDSSGLTEVDNPSAYLLEGRYDCLPGSAVCCLIEGSRPLLLEVQGLAERSQYAMPRRQANGIDYNRLVMLIAVLSKRCNIDLIGMDVYVNIAGGMRVNEPSADLAVLSAIVSSFRNIVIPADTVIIGEVGLSGEVRSVPFISERVKEARKLGFTKVIMPRSQLGSLEPFCDIELVGIAFVTELFRVLKEGRSDA